MAGCTTGAMAVAFAQPTDVVKVRFQAQVRLDDGGRRYNGTMDAYRTIARDEGVRGLWKGNLIHLSFLLHHEFQLESCFCICSNVAVFLSLCIRLHAQHNAKCHRELCGAGHL